MSVVAKATEGAKKTCQRRKAVMKFSAPVVDVEKFNNIAFLLFMRSKVVNRNMGIFYSLCAART
jgi:hypothetical protein